MGEPVALDPPAARDAAATLATIAGDVSQLADETLTDAGLGELFDESLRALTLLREIDEELTLGDTFLVDLADLIESADGLGFGGVFAFCASLGQLGSELAASLQDAIGYLPSDHLDPARESTSEHPLGHFGWMPLFDESGPLASDVDQGAVGDCWLLASFAAIADSDPGRIRDLITDHGDGTYTVHFDDGDITVDDQLPYTIVGGRPTPVYAGSAESPLWPAIVEKAMAMRMGGSYNDISGDWGKTAFEAVGSDTHTVDLNPRRRRDPSDTSVFNDLEQQLFDQDSVVANSFGAFGMGAGHSWSVVETENDNGRWVTIRNPWGSDGIREDETTGELIYHDGSVVEFAGGTDPALIDVGQSSDGLITMRIDVFTANFRNLEFEERS